MTVAPTTDYILRDTRNVTSRAPMWQDRQQSEAMLREAYQQAREALAKHEKDFFTKRHVRVRLQV